MEKVLVIDDDESILDAISLVLEDEGFKVQTSPKGEETIRRIYKFKPDAILLDILMSGIDGRQICKEIKNTRDLQHIPVIMISAHPTAKQSSKEYGADDFLEKPFNTHDLVKMVKKHTRN